MSQMNLEKFKKTINDWYLEQPSNPTEHVQNVLIAIGDDLYSKSETLEILKAVNPIINPLKVKKIVSLNKNQKLIIDSGSTTNVFILDQELTEDEKNLFKKDQLLFVEDDNDNTKIKVYKILFNESEDENSAELVELKDISLKSFNDLFINSGFLRNEDIFNILQESNNYQTAAPVLNKNYFRWNSYGNNRAGIINELKTNLQLADDDIEDDYFIYQEDDKVIIEGIKNSNYKQELNINLNDGFKKNDIFYFRKINGEDSWKTYKIHQKNFLTEREYRGYHFKDLRDEEFNDLKQLSVPPQLGFTIISANNNGLATYFKKEQRTIDDLVIFYCKKRQVGFLPGAVELPESLDINDDNPATIRTMLENKSQEGLYSLVIDNGNIKITNLKSEPESLFFEQALSLENKEHWLTEPDDNKYKKVYFAKNVNPDLVEKWVVNDDQNQLQCVEIVKLADLRKHFANNNLFYVPELITTEGIHLGKNGAEIAAKTSQRSNATISSPVAKEPPVVIYNVINLKWDSNVKMWNLNVTTRENTLDTKLKLKDEESLILKKLITENNNANTVILFNKYDGKFLRAYYINENNKKVNCSNILTDEEKNHLSNINKKVKKRIDKPIMVNPICYKDNNSKRFSLSLINKKWYVLCCEQYEEDKQIKAEIQLTDKEISRLSQLVKYSVDMDITFDNKNAFKSIKYRNFVGKNEYSFINKNNLPINNSDLLQKVFTAINDKENLTPENNDVQWKPWDRSSATAVNNIPASAVNTNCLPSSQQQL